MKSLGQIAYEAYFAYANGKSLISGQALPTWEQQREDVQSAWQAAGIAAKAADNDLREERSKCGG